MAEAFGDGKTGLTSHRAMFGTHILALDDAAEVRIGLANVSLPAHISARQLLDGTVADHSLAGKVVILAYTGSRSPTLNVRGATVMTHQVFLAQLRELVGILRRP